MTTEDLSTRALVTPTRRRGPRPYRQQSRSLWGRALRQAVMIIMVVIAMLADRVFFGVLEKTIHRRFGLAVAE